MWAASASAENRTIDQSRWRQLWENKRRHRCRHPDRHLVSTFSPQIATRLTLFLSQLESSSFTKLKRYSLGMLSWLKMLEYLASFPWGLRMMSYFGITRFEDLYGTYFSYFTLHITDSKRDKVIFYLLIISEVSK